MEVPPLPSSPSLGSSPPNTDSMDLEIGPIESSSPTLPVPKGLAQSGFNWDLSSDPLAPTTQPITPIFDLSAQTTQQSRKRPLADEASQANQSNKERRTFTSSTTSPIARELVLQARDLLVQAYSATKSRDEQAKLLDLLEVFRDYTEKGKTATTILASQITSLESATRKLEAKARNLGPGPIAPQKATYANVANSPSISTTTSTSSTTGTRPTTQE